MPLKMPTAKVLEQQANNISNCDNNNSQPNNNNHHRRSNHRMRSHRQTNAIANNKFSSNSISTTTTISTANNNNNNNNNSQNVMLNQDSNTSQFESISSISSSGSMQSSNATTTAPTIIRSNAEYDRIRNQTLMFFLDRLIISTGEERGRSLHDLSCLFGSKEFTREMRQIVGASRNGLRKFLESFPALFTIEGDRVHLTSLTKLPSNSNQNNNNNNNNLENCLTRTTSDLQNNNDHMSSGQFDEEADRGAGGRDYKREAVDYFSEKLAQFGQSLVPIRYLFGYRSQASQEVRHVSGRNSHEFRQFLLNHADKFELVGEENVILRNNNKETSNNQTSSNQINVEENHSTQQFNSLMSLECRLAESNVSMDPYLNKQLATLIGSKMRQDEVKELTLADLHSRMANQIAYTKQIKSLNDLRMLLRMHPRLFKHDWQQHNLLQAMNKDDDGDLYNQLAQSKVHLLEPQTSATAMRRFSLATSDSKSQLSKNIEEFSGPTSLLIANPSSLKQNNDKNVASQSTITSGLNGSIRSALRADAPPFVPAHLQRSQSSLASSCNAYNTKQIIANEAHESLRSYLIRASASNKANYNPLKPANQRPMEKDTSDLQAKRKEKSIVTEQEQLRARWISVVREASNIISRIMSTCDAIALDCKGFNLGLNGEISLIQIAFISNISNDTDDAITTTTTTTNDMMNPEAEKKPEVCLFDLKTNLELAYLLKPLLESEKIVKIIHDVRNKSNALYNQFNIMLNNVFDTQVANLVIQQQETAKPAYKSRYISIQKLCEIYGNDQLNKYRNLIKSKTRHHSGQNSSSNGNLGARSSSAMKASDVNYWLARPLTDSMVYELTMDVYCLIGGVYQRLKSTIKPEYEPLFKQLNQECVLARIKPDEIRSVKKERKIDLEVIDLKRKLYTGTMDKLVLSNREIRLLRHIDLTPEVRAKIEHCKKVAKKLERLDMKAAKLLQEENGVDSAAEDNDDDDDDDEDNADDNENNDTNTCDITKSYLLGERQPGLDALATLMDELKDKMIQDTTNFLDSFDEDEDEAELAAATASLTINQQHNHNISRSNSNNLQRINLTTNQHHVHKHHDHHDHHQTMSLENSGDCCRCNCHRTSSSSASSSSRASSLNNNQMQISLPASNNNNNDDSQQTTNEDPQSLSKSETVLSTNEPESLPESSSSLVDSAVQCNLALDTEAEDKN